MYCECQRELEEVVQSTYPGALSQAVKTQLVCDLGSVHGILDSS